MIVEDKGRAALDNSISTTESIQMLKQRLEPSNNSGFFIS